RRTARRLLPRPALAAGRPAVRRHREEQRTAARLPERGDGRPPLEAVAGLRAGAAAARPGPPAASRPAGLRERRPRLPDQRRRGGGRGRAEAGPAVGLPVPDAAVDANA